MKVDTEQLRKQYASHYAAMTDDALLEIDPEDLTPDAQACLGAELNDRGLGSGGGSPAPEWIDDSISICSFIANPGGSATKEAGAACEALQSAGIPSHIASEEVGDPRSNEEDALREMRAFIARLP